jgi:hypothetical protein
VISHTLRDAHPHDSHTPQRSHTLPNPPSPEREGPEGGAYASDVVSSETFTSGHPQDWSRYVGRIQLVLL